MASMAATLPRLMMETTFLATSEKLWPPPEMTFGCPLSSPAKLVAKNASMAARSSALSRSPRARTMPLSRSQEIAGVLKMAAQSCQPLVAHQHQEMGFRHPHRRCGIEAAGAVFDGVAAVSRKRLADAQHDARQRFRRQAFDGITIEAGNLPGRDGGHAA